MKNNSKANYLDVLQILRGFAALMVVVHHSVGSIKYYHKIQHPVLDFIGSTGKYGVDFFFVLSGFIISYSAFYKYDEPNAFKNYVKNRLIRIYVPYLPIGIFMLLVYTLLPNFSNGNRELSVLTSLTLIPYGNPALSVAWTLSFELFFYLVFSISFFFRKLWIYFISIWYVLILVFNYGCNLTASTNNAFLKLFFSTYNIEFLIGFYLSWLVIKKIKFTKKTIFVSLILTLSSFLFIKLNKIELFKFDLNFLFSIFTFIIVYIAIVFYNKKINKSSLFMMIGNATYSIYLIHNPLQMIVLRFYPKINSYFGVFIAVLLVLILSSFIGYLYYLIFEKKAINFIKSKLIK